VLFNSDTARWRELFTRLYEESLRGSVAASKNAPMQIIYDSKVVTGWMVSLTQDLQAASEMMVPISFNMIVIRDSTFTPEEELEDGWYDSTILTDSYLDSNKLSIINDDGTLSNLSGKDSYVRKASIKLPLRPKVTTRSGGTGKCRIKPTTKKRSGEIKDVNKTQGAVSSTSPVEGSCDFSQAVIHHRKELEKAVYNKSKAKPKDQGRYQKKIDDAHAQLERAQKWIDKNNIKDEQLAQEIKRTAATVRAQGGIRALKVVDTTDKNKVHSVSTRMSKALKKSKKK